VMPISLLVAAVLIAVLTFVGWQKQVVAERQHQLQTFAAQHVQRAATNIANYLEGIQQRLEMFVGSRSLRDAFLDGERESLKQAGQSFLRSLPTGTRVDIYQLNEARIDANASTPLRFSELDLIRRAERREDLLPEA